jgi:GLPGLI family protein
MKTKIKITVLFVLLGLSHKGVWAQSFTGIASYKSATSMQMELDGEEMPGVDHEELQRQLSKGMQRDYTLTFNAYESLFKQDESLDGGAVEAQSGGAMIRIVGNDNVIYRNTKEQVQKEKADLFGKVFLIDDAAEMPEWTITKEKKQIGKYQCTKAVYSRVSMQTEFNSEHEGEPKMVTDTVQVEAWFTADIPVSHGPEGYWGLPGLIMEVHDDSRIFICTKVVLKTNETLAIEPPKTGKKVTAGEFDKIQDEKMQEMMNQYRGNDGDRTVIRIRG